MGKVKEFWNKAEWPVKATVIAVAVARAQTRLPANSARTWLKRVMPRAPAAVLWMSGRFSSRRFWKAVGVLPKSKPGIGSPPPTAPVVSASGMAACRRRAAAIVSTG